MDLNHLLANNESEWRGAMRVMQATLSIVSKRLDIRSYEIDEIVSEATEILMADDFKVLRRAESHKALAFIKSVAVFTAKNHIKVRRRHEWRERPMTEKSIEEIGDAVQGLYC